jgi:hypothetical protein
MLSEFGNNYRSEQLFSLMKNVISRIRTCLANKHLERCRKVATTEIELHRYCKINQAESNANILCWLILLKEITVPCVHLFATVGLFSRIFNKLP